MEHLRNETTDEFEDVSPFGPEEFTDGQIAAAERAVFARVPSIIAHSSELPRPNDFITHQMPRNKVIVVRQEDGGVKAFVNLCRHRGALLEERDAGRCRGEVAAALGQELGDPARRAAREDFPLLRSSQAGMESANAGRMMLGRSEIANQVFHRELRKLLAEGR